MCAMTQGKTRPPAPGDGTESDPARRQAIESLIDDIGAQSFPASDPPAWGVVSSRLEESSREAPTPPIEG